MLERQRGGYVLNMKRGAHYEQLVLFPGGDMTTEVRRFRCLPTRSPPWIVRPWLNWHIFCQSRSTP